ncbi:MAG: sulfotransferase family 2 domain-containing protein [Planctomycetota bacterium]
MPFSFLRKPLDKLYLFVHIPKCAGTTVLASLRALGGKRLIEVAHSPESKRQAFSDLKKAVEKRRISFDTVDAIAGHDVFHGMHEVSYRPAFYFTVLRDPTARYISHYKHLVDRACDTTSGDFKFARSRILENGKPISLHEFASRQNMTNVMTNYLAAAAHPDRSTKRWQVTSPDDLLDLAEQSLKQMSWIGFVENYPADLQHICSLLRVKPARASNQSITRVANQLPEKTMELIRFNNSLDLKVYEMAKQLRSLS